MLEEMIRQRTETFKLAGFDLENTCGSCLKTKFADGIGHICYYCEKKVCARCGGKVTLRHVEKVSVKHDVTMKLMMVMTINSKRCTAGLNVSASPTLVID